MTEEQILRDSLASGADSSDESKLGEVGPGAISARAAVNTVRCRCRVARVGRFVSRADLSGPTAAREVHEAATDRYPGQEGWEPSPGLGWLDHAERLRGHRPVDERGRPGRAAASP